MCGLLLKCFFLVVMIHGFRILGRLAGPRWSALVLGLPSTTAIVLIICGCEWGSEAAIKMAESSLLGLAAAVALPLAYAQTVRLGWRLPVALAAAVAGYLAVAFTLGCMTADGVLPRLSIAIFAIVAGSYCAGRLPIAERSRAPASLSPFQVMAARTAIPATYVLVLGIAERLAGPSWAGLMSTFPSMSLVVLAVTHLEAGPAEASRIAKALPVGNTSTLAFLAAFRLASAGTGLAGGQRSDMRRHRLPVDHREKSRNPRLHPAQHRQGQNDGTDADHRPTNRDPGWSASGRVCLGAPFAGSRSCAFPRKAASQRTVRASGRNAGVVRELDHLTS